MSSFRTKSLPPNGIRHTETRSVIRSVAGWRSNRLVTMSTRYPRPARWRLSSSTNTTWPPVSGFPISASAPT